MKNAKKLKKQKARQKERNERKRAKALQLPEDKIAMVTGRATFGSKDLLVCFEITYRKSNGKIEKLYLSRGEVDNKNTLRIALLNADCNLPRKGKDAAIMEEIQTANPSNEIEFALRPGWHGDSFVFPDVTIFPPQSHDGAECVLWAPSDDGIEHLLANGALEGWCSQVAKLCGSSPIIIFAVGVALSAPLYRPFADMSRIIHFSGGSGVGKGLTLKVAHSVSGRPKNGKLTTWSTTMAALQETAIMRSDVGMFLDELAAIGHDRMGFIEESTFRLSAGVPRAVSNSWKRSQPRMADDWHGPIISAGEEAPADLLGGKGKKRLPGQERRFINVPVVAEGQEHVFKELPAGCKTLGDAYVLIERGAKAHHGAALRAFVQRLVGLDDADALIRQLIKAFYEMNGVGNDSWEQSYAQPFALAFVALKLGIDWGILPWDQDITATAVCDAYRRSRKTVQDAKTSQREALRALYDVLGGKEVIDLRKGREATRKEARNKKSVFRLPVRGNPKQSMFVLRRERLAEIVKDSGSLPLVIGALREADLLLLEPGRPDVVTKQVTIPGAQNKTRLVCIKGAALSKLPKLIVSLTN